MTRWWGGCASGRATRAVTGPATRSHSRGLPSPASPFKKYEPVEGPEAKNHLANDVSDRHRTERARVRGEGAVVSHHEDLPIRDREWVSDLRRLRLRRAVGLRDVHLFPVHEHVPVPQIDRLAADGDDALHVGDRRVRGRGVEHDDVAALWPAEAVVELAHEDAVVLLEGGLHGPLAHLGHLNDEQVEDDRDDNRESERLDDFEDGPPRERRFVHRYVFGRSYGLGSGHYRPV